MPRLPDSVKVVVYEGRWALSTLDAFPPRLQALHVQTPALTFLILHFGCRRT